MAREVVSRWWGVALVDGERTLRTTPLSADVLIDRMRVRHRGERAPEEDDLLAQLGDGPTVTKDRRLVRPGGPEFGGSNELATPSGWARGDLRTALLALAAEELTAARDPAGPIEEAVRTLSDLDGVANTLGERLVLWDAREAGEPRDDPASPESVARRLTSPPPAAPPGGDPTAALAAAERGLGDLYLAVGRLRAQVEAAVAATVPSLTPNLTALLGPMLAGRLLSLSGGLDRLARLPASTIQVLGAERAFFEHLRGRAPPPRHGVLFLHPRIQGAPRRQRGRLARALAGKVAIAARLDEAGAPVRTELAVDWEARAREIRESPAPRKGARRRERLRPPLHRTADDR